MLYEYLTTHYQTNEPIFLSDVILPDITNNYLRQMFKQLCDCGKLIRFNTGVYYLPDASISNKEPISARTVAEYKYISRGADIYGYYSGQSFSSQLGLIEPPVNLLEIVSNDAGGKYREIILGDTTIILRKPKFHITKANWRVLQFLDFLKDVDLYTGYKEAFSSETLKTYMQLNHLTRDIFDSYIGAYPDKIYRTIYELNLYEALNPKEYTPKTTPAKRRRELSVELL